MEPKKLYRSRDNRMIAGVCGGLAEYFNVDPVIKPSRKTDKAHLFCQNSSLAMISFHRTAMSIFGPIVLQGE
jgi:hypothetical protein